LQASVTQLRFVSCFSLELKSLTIFLHLKPTTHRAIPCRKTQLAIDFASNQIVKDLRTKQTILIRESLPDAGLESRFGYDVRAWRNHIQKIVLGI